MTQDKHVMSCAYRAALVALAAGLAAVSSAVPAAAQTDEIVNYVVTTTEDPFTGDPVTLPASDGSCSLREAIIAAARPVDETTDCGPGGAERRVRISFAGDGRGVHELQDQLVLAWEVISGSAVYRTVKVWIDGAGSGPTDARVTLSGRDQHRILLMPTTYAGATPIVLGGSELHLSDLTLTRGFVGPAAGTAVSSGKGGAVFSSALLFSSYRVTYTHNEAQDGAAVFLFTPNPGTNGPGGNSYIMSSTFAYNRVSQPSLLSYAGGALGIASNKLWLRGSTFFHNRALHANVLSRDLGHWWFGGPDFGHNVFVAPPNESVASCHAHVGGTADWRVSDLRFNRRTGVADDTACLSTALPDGSGLKVDWLIEPLLDENFNALADHGGWADTVLFTAESEMHDLGPGFPAKCGTFSEMMNSTSWGWYIPAINGWSGLAEGVSGVPTDARGVLRPSDRCDAGAIQREAQIIDFPLPTTALVGGTLPMPTATSGGPVSLTAGPSHICDVFDDAVRYRAEGSCTVVATQEGTALFRAAASVTRTFDITAAPKTPRQIAFVGVPVSAQVGGSWQIATTVTPNDGSIPTYALGAGSTGCTLTGLATVSFDAAGTCVVWAGLPETDAYLAASAETSFAITATPSAPTFSDFSGPISQSEPNVAKAGQGVAVKFSLGGDWGLNVLAPGSPTSWPMACAAGSDTGPAADTVAVGKSVLSYDPATDTYTYVWKTDKAWANTCRRLEIRFADGGTATADFHFKK